MTRRTAYFAIMAAIAMILASTNAHPVQGPDHVEARDGDYVVPLGKVNRGTPRALDDAEAIVVTFPGIQSVPGSKTNRAAPRALDDAEASFFEPPVPGIHSVPGGKLNRGTPRALQ
ncbi:hypothetical protein BGZ83_008806 [Gryganskiella cystojenkinii]|nr:hypothetical protein BGZ83_008806 [Gryganskiella cystojenkinii]